MVLLPAMLTRNQHNRISLLAVISLLIGLIAAVPHYGHADVSHGVSAHTTQGFDESVVDPTSADKTQSKTTEGGAATECDHGCHLGHHFNGVLGNVQNAFTRIANHPPGSKPQKFLLITKRRDLRPPISQIS